MAAALIAVEDAAAGLGEAELRKIESFAQSPALRDVPDWARAEMEPRVQAAHEQARTLLAGRGAELAEHFLTHTGQPPSNSAWFFVFEAVGDSETALVLASALTQAPEVRAGPAISAGGRTWLRERDAAEIHLAIASVLVNEPVRRDARVLNALLESFHRLRPEPGRPGPGDAARVVELLGMLRGPEATAVLRELAEDPEPEIRGLAVQGLGRVAGEDAGQPPAEGIATVVSRALLSDPDPNARIEAAVRGPGLLRALALYALVAPAVDYRPGPRLRLSAPGAESPDPPSPPSGARVVRNEVRWKSPPPRPKVAFEDATRKSLLVSLTGILSRPSGTLPVGGAEMSSGTVRLMHRVLWEIAGRDMQTALQHADRISRTGERYTTQGRFGASWALWRVDREAYLDYRRPRQALAGVLLAAGFAVFLAWRGSRRAALALVLAALGWAAWSWFATGPRELPPPPLQFMTAGAVGFFAAGASVALLSFIGRNSHPGTLWRVAGRACSAAGIAALLAFFVTGYTRWSGRFPIGAEGWELIFDPFGSAIIAAAGATVLALLDGLLLRNAAPPKATAA